MKPIVVLLDTRHRHWGQNPYIALLADSLKPDALAVGFSWRRAILGKYDVVHLHWPEYLTKHNRLQLRLMARVLLTLWILRLLVQRKPIVRTVHNKHPHDSLTNSFDGCLLGILQRMCSRQIWLQDPILSGSPETPMTAVIPHGDYLRWIHETELAFPSDPAVTVPQPHAGTTRLLCFGILKSYKNIDEAVSAVRDAEGLPVRLRVLGSAPDEAYLSNILATAGSDARIEIIPGRVPDRQLIQEIRNSHFVIVPYPEMFNSGVVLMALSLGRPVVARHNPITADLQKEFGRDWVYTYSEGFDSLVLRGLISMSRLSGDVPRWPSERSWSSIGRQHTLLYKACL